MPEQGVLFFCWSSAALRVISSNWMVLGGLILKFGEILEAILKN
jgi:hypothetical protein